MRSNPYSTYLVKLEVLEPCLKHPEPIVAIVESMSLSRFSEASLVLLVIQGFQFGKEGAKVDSTVVGNVMPFSLVNVGEVWISRSEVHVAEAEAGVVSAQGPSCFVNLDFDKLKQQKYPLNDALK